MALRYLIDKSALARIRLKPVYAALQPRIVAGEVARCSIVDLEVLYSAQSPKDYKETLANQRRLRLVPVTQEICERAIQTQAKLAETSQHRGASIPDLIIAACAAEHELTVLHYDADFDLIASVTQQPVEWVVNRDSVD